MLAFGIAITIILSIAMFSITLQDANATTQIGITLSGSCYRSILCPNYTTLAQEFDNTNQFLSGEFDHETGLRKKAPLRNHFLIYDYARLPIVIGVDPDAQWILRMNYHITLEPSHFAYPDKAKGDSKVINNTISIQEDVWIDSCRNARIHYSLLLETMNHLLSKCQQSDDFNYTKTTVRPYIPYAMTDHKYYNYTVWLAKSMQDCKVKC